MNSEKNMENVIYFAGGCFWGMEKLMRSVPGVSDVISGYANGSCEADADYETVCSGRTGFRETVMVKYDPDKMSLDGLLLAYFHVIDPGVKNRQGNDVGTQYQTGVYYTDPGSGEAARRIAELVKGRSDRFFVEIAPLKNFYPAEEYHQNYLGKNPGGYCHIPRGEIKRAGSMRIDPGNYKKPGESEIKARLSPLQYLVSRQGETEPPFANEFWNNFRKGIYVDAVSGEPLFSSTDKFESGCGWPAFSKPIEPSVLEHFRDASHGMERIEVRSRAADSHLGHVFFGEAGSPGGLRYCINSASLRFIPFEDMEAQGYAYLKDIF